MKRKLTRRDKIFHYANGQRIDAPPDGLRGDLSDVYGDLSGVRGDLSDVYGDLSGLRGNLSGVRGDLSDVCGDLDDCEITREDRAKGIDIKDLIDTKKSS